MLAGLAAWQAAQALQDSAQTPSASAPAEPEAAPEDEPGNTTAPASPAPPPFALTKTTTPMTEREAVIGVLNKRNGLSRDVRMKPGQAVRMGDLVVRLRACEQTAPWEPETWTGAFVQVITRETGTRWRKTFSGWLYKESPSLNVVEHPIYDVWVKACSMRHADTGPATLVARGNDAGGSSRSSAPKSATTPEAESPAPESAASSSTE